MQRRMVCRLFQALEISTITNMTPQLSTEDEAATGGEEVQVRREDQDKINRFSRLNQREILLEEEMKTKHVSTYTVLGYNHPSISSLIQGWTTQKDKEDLDEISNELELADEDNLIP